MKGKTTDLVALQAAIAQIPAIQATLNAEPRITSRSKDGSVKWTCNIAIVNRGEDFCHVISRVDKTMAFCVGSNDTVVEYLSDDLTELIDNVLMLEEHEADPNCYDVYVRVYGRKA